MDKKLIVVGNGLGRALDNEHFDLHSAMKSIWKKTGQGGLCAKEKQLIASAIDGISEEDGPEGEEQLFGTQIALFAVENLRTVTKDGSLSKWLTEEAQDFPSALNKYAYLVAKHFFDFDLPTSKKKEWSEFIQDLQDYIWETSPHVATLNYDSLLYAPFVDDKRNKKSICSGYSGRLIDGFYSNGIEKSHFKARGEKISYYLHLHGSPLFYSAGKAVKKHTRSAIDWNTKSPNEHIILCNASLKPIMIERSKALQIYWELLSEILENVTEIIFVGYSGGDDHLNQIVDEKFSTDKPDKKIRIVQRINSANSFEDWTERFPEHKKQIVLSEHPNILEFREW